MVECDDRKIEVSLIQKLFLAGKITTEYRDKMLLERNNILLDFATKTSDKGPLYFVHGVSKSNKYNLCSYSLGASKSISIDRSQVHKLACVDCVLRFVDEMYVLDDETTADVSLEINRMVHSLLKEQSLYFSEKRIDGDFYEVVEIYQNAVLLMNQNSGDCFEEICISKEVLGNLTSGDVLKFLDGTYVVVEK